MKKILVYIFLLLSPVSTQAFLGDDLGLNLYSEIDSGINEYEADAYIYEVVWEQWSIKQQINNTLIANSLPACIQGDISISEFNDIATGNILTLQKKIWDTCRDEQWKLINSQVSEIQSYITDLSREKQAEAERKTRNVYKVARTGMYINGTTNDAPFDLIVDLQKIDEIIFSNVIEYSWEEIDHDNAFRGKLDSRIANSTLSSNVGGENINIDGWSWGNNWGGWWSSNNPDSQADEPTIDTLHGDVCEYPDDSSWLWEEALWKIFKIIPKPRQKIQPRKNVTTSRSSGGSTTQNNIASGWNCDSFFCVTVDFIVYNHKLLWSGKSFSVQKVIETSTEHLRKWANTSLLQSRITTNSFQPSIIIKDLAKIFHMDFIVTTKPAPTINDRLVNNNSALKKNALIEKYYKSLWLEYSYRNSLENFKDSDEEIISILNCAELTKTCVIWNIEEYNSYAVEQALEKEFSSDAIDQTTLYDNNKIFFESFIWLDWLVANLENYSDNLRTVAKQLSQKPEAQK